MPESPVRILGTAAYAGPHGNTHADGMRSGSEAALRPADQQPAIHANKRSALSRLPHELVLPILKELTSEDALAIADSAGMGWLRPMVEASAKKAAELNERAQQINTSPNGRLADLASILAAATDKKITLFPDHFNDVMVALLTNLTPRIHGALGGPTEHELAEGYAMIERALQTAAQVDPAEAELIAVHCRSLDIEADDQEARQIVGRIIDTCDRFKNADAISHSAQALGNALGRRRSFEAAAQQQDRATGIVVALPDGAFKMRVAAVFTGTLAVIPFGTCAAGAYSKLLAIAEQGADGKERTLLAHALIEQFHLSDVETKPQTLRSLAAIAGSAEDENERGALLCALSEKLHLLSEVDAVREAIACLAAIVRKMKNPVPKVEAAGALQGALRSHPLLPKDAFDIHGIVSWSELLAARKHIQTKLRNVPWSAISQPDRRLAHRTHRALDKYSPSVREQLQQFARDSRADALLSFTVSLALLAGSLGQPGDASEHASASPADLASFARTGAIATGVVYAFLFSQAVFNALSGRNKPAVFEPGVL
jgi:hypothetical protein